MVWWEGEVLGGGQSVDLMLLKLWKLLGNLLVVTVQGKKLITNLYTAIISVSKAEKNIIKRVSCLSHDTNYLTTPL